MEGLRDQLQAVVDDDICSGCGLCVEIAPEVFVHVNGLSRLHDEDGWVFASCEPMLVPVKLASKVIEAAENCPGEIIQISYPNRSISSDSS